MLLLGHTFVWLSADNLLVWPDSTAQSCSSATSADIIQNPVYPKAWHVIWHMASRKDHVPHEPPFTPFASLFVARVIQSSPRDDFILCTDTTQTQHAHHMISVHRALVATWNQRVNAAAVIATVTATVDIRAARR